MATGHLGEDRRDVRWPERERRSDAEPPACRGDERPRPERWSQNL